MMWLCRFGGGTDDGCRNDDVVNGDVAMAVTSALAMILGLVTIDLLLRKLL
jgi:hypothetical protein